MSVSKEARAAILKAVATEKAARAKSEKLGEKPLTRSENQYGFPWTCTTYGDDGATLWVSERDERPGVVRVRLPKQPDGKRPYLALDNVQIRNVDSGVLLKRGCSAAIDAAKAAYRRHCEKPSEESNASREFTTYREVLAYYLDTETGKTMGARYRENIGSMVIQPGSRNVIAEVDRLIGLDSKIANFGVEIMRRLWRKLASESTDGGGADKAGRIIKTIVAAVNHCKLSGRLADTTARAPKGWEKTLRTEWTKLTGTNVMTPFRPSYTVAETVKLLAHLDEAHPRLRLALEVTLGYRVVQVAEQAMRSSITEEGIFGMRLRFFDSKGMKSVAIDLSPRQQRALKRAWARDGLLGDLEAAYQAGEIQDYALIPAGKLRDGVAQLKYHAKSTARSHLGAQLLRLERIAGVPRVPKRGFHGLRRTVAKLVARVTDDAELRDLAQGWKPGSGTRQALYDQAEEDDERLGRAAEARTRAIETVSRSASPAEHAAELRGVLIALANRVESAVTADERTADAYESVRYALAQAMAAFEQAESSVADLPELMAKTPREDAIAAHAQLCEEIRQEISRRGITAKAAGALMGVKSTSDMSRIVQGTSRGFVKLERLQALAAALKAAPGP